MSVKNCQSQKMFSAKKGVVVSPDESLTELLESMWDEDILSFSFYCSGSRALEHVFNNPPDVLIIDNNINDMSGEELARLVKGENVYRQVPVVMFFDEKDSMSYCDFGLIEVDDFLVRPFTECEVKQRINLALFRASRAMDANPLSKLPGNTSIIQRIQNLIDKKEDFALAYCDLDYFKSFNDKYGFSRGDEVLMMTARIIVNIVKNYGGDETFVGHVGGDDFVIITQSKYIENICQQIISSFDSIVPNFYDQEDRVRKSIVSTDRQGQIQTFPLMAISIAVVCNNGAKLKHYGEVSTIAMGLKKKAKESITSSYVIDQREK